MGIWRRRRLTFPEISYKRCDMKSACAEAERAGETLVPFVIVLRRIVRDPYKVKDRPMCLVVYASNRREALEKAEYHHSKWIEMHKGIAGVVRLPSSGRM